MQTETQKALYYQLELITPADAQFENRSRWSWWTRMWHACLQTLTADEPQVWSSMDRFGHTWWYVYCPQTGQTAQFSSSEEVRIWLDQNFYSA